MNRMLMVIATVLALATAAPAADPLPCFGDCDGDGSVAVGEIVTCVRIALGLSAIAACPESDGDDDGRVEINELIQTVAVALETDVPKECTARRCEFSGGSLGIRLCCRSADSFPDTCSVGACACAPADSHEVAYCDCGAGQCFDGWSCIAAAGS